MTETVQVLAPFTQVIISIVLDADWADSFPVLMDGDGVIDLSLYQRQLDLYIRPTFDHDTLIAHYASVDSYAAEGIFFDDATAGEASIFVPRESLIATIPPGTYDQFLVMTEQDVLRGTIHTEIWRGKLKVFPGNVGPY